MRKSPWIFLTGFFAAIALVAILALGPGTVIFPNSTPYGVTFGTNGEYHSTTAIVDYQNPANGIVLGPNTKGNALPITMASDQPPIATNPNPLTDNQAQCSINGSTVTVCAVNTQGMGTVSFTISNNSGGNFWAVQGLTINAGSTNWVYLPFLVVNGAASGNNGNEAPNITGFEGNNSGGTISSVEGNGTVIVNSAGFSQVRLQQFSGTGSATVNAEAGPASALITTTSIESNDAGNILSLNSQGTGTVNSVDTLNPYGRGIKCLIDVTAVSGTPSMTVAIQWKDISSGIYTSLLTSAAITGTGSTQLTVYPGITATANVSASDVLPKFFRLQAVVGGTTPSVTAIMPCTLLN